MPLLKKKLNQPIGSIGDSLSPVKKGKVYRIKKRCLPSKGIIEDASDILNTYCSIEPFLRVEQYHRDLRIKFSTGVPGRNKDKTKPRGEINHFSKKSVKRCKFALRNSIHLMKAIVCLTYPAEYPDNGREFKRHLDTFEKRLQRMKAFSFSVMEFQDRGAPHYHILITGIIDRLKLAKMWYEIVGSHDSKHLQAGTSIQFIVDDNDNRLERDRVRYREMCRKGHRNVKRMFISRSEAESYMIGYFKKNDQKVVPSQIRNAGRFWSHSRGLIVSIKSVVLQGDEHALKRQARLLRRWYIARLRSWGIRYKGQFLPEIIWDGMLFVQSLRQYKTLTLSDA